MAEAIKYKHDIYIYERLVSKTLVRGHFLPSPFLLPQFSLISHIKHNNILLTNILLNINTFVKISSVNHIYLESSNTLLRNLDTIYKVVSWKYEYKSFNNINSVTSPFLSI